VTFKTTVLLIIHCITLLISANVAAVEYEPHLFTPSVFTAESNSKLSNKQVLRLEQDSRGFIWVGTRRGVYRFDGYTYEKLAASNTGVDLSTIYVRSLLADGDFLWIGSMSQGAFRVDLRTYHTLHFVHEEEKAGAIRGNQVNGIDKGPNGKIWLAHSFGLERFNEADLSFEHFFSGDNQQERYHNYLLDLEFDATGTLWLSTAKGLASLQPSAHQFLLLNPDNNPEFASESIKGVMVRRLFLASDGRLWLATQKQGTHILDLAAQKVIALTDSVERIDVVNTAIVEVSQEGHANQIWISGMTGIEIRDAKSGHLLKVLHGNPIDPFGLASDTVYPMLRADSGLIWLGVNDVGLQFFNPATQNFLYFDRFAAETQELFSTFINKVIPLNETSLLVFTENDAYRLNLETGKVSRFLVNEQFLTNGQSLTNEQAVPRKIAGGLIDKNGVYWLGDSNGQLYRAVDESQEISKYRLPLTKNEGVFVRTITEGKSGELWVGSDRGLVKLDRNLMKFTALKNENGSPFINYVRNLFVDSKNRLWIGTTSGLGLLLPGSERVEFYSVAKDTAQTLSHNTIYQVLENKAGEILVYTPGGIDRLVIDEPNKKQFTPFADDITSQIETEERLIQLDNGHYWLGNRFVLDEQGKVLIHHTKLDGAIDSGRTNSFFQLSSRYLLRVTASWMNLIDRSRVNTWSYQPKTVVTEVSVGNQLQPFNYSNPTIHLYPQDDQFAVRFSTLDFSSPNLNQYRYKLNGYDETWVSTPSEIRQAKYTALPAGAYSLLVQGSNRNGIWQELPLQLNITVEPKFFETLWFQIMSGAVILFCAYLLFRWRLRLAHQKQQDAFEKKQAILRSEMMTELMEQKNQMLAEVTHDLRTPLATIKIQLEALQDGVLKADEKTYETLQNRINNLNHLVSDLYRLSLVEESSLLLKKQMMPLNVWLEDIVRSFVPMFQQKSLTLTYHDSTDSELIVFADKERLSQVCSNLLKNSYRYTNSGGLVRVTLTSNIDNCIITVEDSAPAIAESELDRIFKRLYRADDARERESSGSGLGLWICRSIIQAHDGEIEARLSPLGGLSVMITLPKPPDKQHH